MTAIRRSKRQAFDDEKVWKQHLKKLKITHQRHLRIATEGALPGTLVACGFPPDLVIISDDAGQFDIPLHNNLSEGDIREYVIKRKISGSTRSENGRRARDTFASLKKTCKKQRISFWDFLLDRLKQAYLLPYLPDILCGKVSLVPKS